MARVGGAEALLQVQLPEVDGCRADLQSSGARVVGQLIVFREAQGPNGGPHQQSSFRAAPRQE